MKKIILLLFLISTPTFAGLVLEGYVGYGLSLDYEKTDWGEIKYDGGLAGARVGISLFDVIMIGGEYGYAFNKLKFTDTTTDIGYDISTPRSDYGVFAGIIFPIFLRIWGTYYALTEMKVDDPLNSNLKGVGFGAGVGWIMLPFISINAEYRRYKYNSSTGSLNLSDDDRLKGNYFLLSIGLFANLF